MSIGAFRWAKTWTCETPLQKYVLVMIADHYNDRVRRAWPSMQTLADETGMSRRTVVRHVEALEKCNLIEVEQWVNNDTGSQMANRYCLPLYDAKSTKAKVLPVIAIPRSDDDGNVIYEAA